MCDYISTQKWCLDSHIESVHEGKVYQCSYCGEVFKTNERLEGHIALTHDRTKLFTCSICSSGFRSKGKLKEHVSFVHEKIGKSNF